MVEFGMIFDLKSTGDRMWYVQNPDFILYI